MADRRAGLLGALAAQAGGPSMAAPSPSYNRSSGGGCGCGGGTPFADYAPAGILRFVSTGPGSVVTASVDVTGSNLPADSVVVLGAHVNAAGVPLPTGDAVVQQFTSDNQPSALGNGGASLALADLNNQNAPAIAIQRRATRTFSAIVQFPTASAANDVIILQALAKGSRFLAVESCEV